jgi:GNAT superfamily N-acetyltransferase
MSTPSRRRTITLQDGARVTLRSIAPEDKPLLVASYERLSEESRYRRFFSVKKELSAAELEYLVDVDHNDHEAIVAIDPSSGEALGVARYIRASAGAEVAEVAVVVADDWQGRGVGRALLDRLTYRARHAGVRRFSALVQGDNRASIGLLEGVGDTRRRYETGEVELIIELPPERVWARGSAGRCERRRGEVWSRRRHSPTASPSACGQRRAHPCSLVYRSGRSWSARTARRPVPRRSWQRCSSPPSSGPRFTS